jgi:hypothetical protein
VARSITKSLIPAHNTLSRLNLIDFEKCELKGGVLRRFLLPCPALSLRLGNPGPGLGAQLAPLAFLACVSFAAGDRGTPQDSAGALES